MKAHLTILTAVFVAAIAAPASASETRHVCNRVIAPGETELKDMVPLRNDVWFALGFLRNGEWVSSGWWHLRPGECQRLDNFPTPRSRVYLSVFEHNPSTGESYTWPGKFVFCTRDESYRGNPAERCNAGFEKTDFFSLLRGGTDKSRWALPYIDRRGVRRVNFFQRGR